jgi:hypothetical protein
MGNTLSFSLLLEGFARLREPLNWRAMRRGMGVRAMPIRPAGREKYMKTKKHHATALRVSEAAREHEVQREIDSFLRALSSYPDRFAREPYLSFQQHLSSIVTAAHPPGTDEDPRR